MKLSVVTTLYNSSNYIFEFHRQASAAARQYAGNDYEIIFVNDGSPDDSVDIAIGLTRNDPNVIVVDLSRNFGHHKAMMAGLVQSRGTHVFLIDSDLEESPKWLNDFAVAMADENADVIYGVQEQRKGGWFESVSGNLYYRLFNLLSNIDHPHNIVTARLMSRRYVDALLQYREREMVISCLWVITGFKQVARTVTKLSRGETSYSLARKFSHTTNAITSFSDVPLRIIFYVGLILFVGSMISAVYLVYQRLVTTSPVDGWTSVMVSIWMLGGLTISFVGLIGIYLSKIFSETKQRPSFIVRAVHGQSIVKH